MQPRESITRHRIDCHQDALMTMPATLEVRPSRLASKIVVSIEWDNQFDSESYDCCVNATYNEWMAIVNTLVVGERWTDTEQMLTAIPHEDSYYRLVLNIDGLIGMVFLSDTELLEFRDAVQAIEAETNARAAHGEAVA